MNPRPSAQHESSRKLPAFGREILELRRRGLVPANERGAAEAVYVVLDDWKTCARRRWRVVVPKDAAPAELNFAFIAGLECFVIWRLSLTTNARRDALLRSLLAAGPRFLFCFDWEDPAHSFQIIGPKQGLLRPEYAA